MFGTSGIRGIYGRDITEELAMKVAGIFAQGELVISRDTRASGVPLLHAAAAGALSSGADAIDIGIAPTPTAALAGKEHGCRAIMITASHNPQEYNGLKLMEEGKEIGKALEREIEERYQFERPVESRQGRMLAERCMVRKHKELVLSLVDVQAIGRKKPKVLVDCNGAASAITPSLLSDLGCNVVSVNAGLEGFFRPSEPNEANLAYLPELIRLSKADFALAHDGDGDRCVVFDEKGEMLPLDVQLAMMIDHELSHSENKRVVSTVEASLSIRDVVERQGGSIDITPVGSTYVGDALESQGALFGGEPCGEYIYKDGVHVPDAVLAAAKFAEMFCMKGPFSEQKTGYRTHFMARERFPAKDKHAAIGRVKASLDVKGEVRDDDGIRVDEEDGWFLIRASGTEPIIRLTMEYRTREGLEERKAGLSRLIMDSLS